jgi:hypothetical protein
MKHSLKKLISLVLVLAISFAIAVPAFAAEKANTGNATYAYIKNNMTGHKFRVKVYKSTANKVNGLTDGIANGASSQMYSFSINKSSIEPLVFANNSGSQTKDE